MKDLNHQCFSKTLMVFLYPIKIKTPTEAGVQDLISFGPEDSIRLAVINRND
jgi:hypothetical protein